MSALSVPTCGRPSAVSSILTAMTGFLDVVSPVSGLTAVGGTDPTVGGGALVPSLEPLPEQPATAIRPATAAAEIVRPDRIIGLPFVVALVYPADRHSSLCAYGVSQSEYPPRRDLQCGDRRGVI